jgi:D-aminopeptidase
MTKPRARDLGLPFPGTPGPLNAITDVPGIMVGYTTILAERGEAGHEHGDGPVRTGVTAVLPRGHDPVPRPVWAGQFSLNGNGEMTGVHWIHDAGYFIGPVCITNTHSVGIVHHAATRWTIDTYAEAFRAEQLWAMPVVAETYDGLLSDVNGQHVTAAHARGALDAAATGPLAEGNVGGGTGMVCYEFKGGTGTASRRAAIGGETFTIGAVVQANHGRRDWLTILGVPVGREMREDLLFGREAGSIIVVLGTDAPLSALSLRHVARRATIGIGRGGAVGGNSSGDIFLAFSVANPCPMPQLMKPRVSLDVLNNEQLDPLYLAAVEAVEEAVVNAMVAADSMTTVRPPGKLCRAIDHDRLCEIMRKYGRL